MKILKAGKLKEKLRGTCPECDCEIEFTTTEAVHQSEQSEPGFFHRCPTKGCGELIQGFRISADVEEKTATAKDARRAAK